MDKNKAQNEQNRVVLNAVSAKLNRFLRDLSGRIDKYRFQQLGEVKSIIKAAEQEVAFAEEKRESWIAEQNNLIALATGRIQARDGIVNQISQIEEGRNTALASLNGVLSAAEETELMDAYSRILAGRIAVKREEAVKDREFVKKMSGVTIMPMASLEDVVKGVNVLNHAFIVDRNQEVADRKIALHERKQESAGIEIEARRFDEPYKEIETKIESDTKNLEEKADILASEEFKQEAEGMKKAHTETLTKLSNALALAGF